MCDGMYDKEYVKLVAETDKQQGHHEMKSEIVKWLRGETTLPESIIQIILSKEFQP